MVMTVMPPPQYVHPPHVPVLEMRLSWQDMHVLCRGRTGSMLACSFFGHVKDSTVNTCFVVLPKESWQGVALNIAKLRQHEIAHCNGWPGNHPGGHWEDVSMFPQPQRPWWKWW